MFKGCFRVSLRRRLLGWGLGPLLALTAALGAPGAAEARCLGRDMMSDLRVSDPSAHKEILARAKAVANGSGRFWEVRAPGVAPSYLYGTLHSTEAAERGLLPAAREALSQARVLMVELTPTEQKRLEKRLTTDPSYAIQRSGPTLSQRLSADERALAEGVLSSRGLSLAAAEKLKPWLIVSMIAVPRCEQAEIAAGRPVLDDAIATLARERGIPVLGLETYEETFRAFDGLTDAEMTGLLVDGFSAAHREEDLRRTLEELYARGEIAAITEFNVWFAENTGAVAEPRAGAEALQRALIGDRNHLWMDRIVPEIAKGGVFAAFGALHLPGADGMVTLLRLAGFSIRRHTH
ncbi:MAG: TraB/GumN family protein [Pseudomonadota bacterium]